MPVWTRRVVRVAAWLAIALPGIEAIARQLTRTRPIGFLPEHPAAMALWPLAGLALLALTQRRQTRGVGACTVLAALFAAGLCLQLHVGARLQSDGFYYYAYLRSIAFDRDVNFLNDYRLLGQGDKPQLFEPTVTGHAHSAWTIGPAIVWSPFFAIGHVAATALHARGVDVAVDGTSYPYRQAICIAGLFYTLLGAWFALGFTRGVAGRTHAGLAVALTFGGSFLAWYAIVEPTMTHGPSMAAVAGFAWLWAATMKRRTTAGWAWLGVVLGLAALIRWQNAIFGLLPAAEIVALVWTTRRGGERARVIAAVRGGAVFSIAWLVALLPQMLAWNAIYGSFIAVSPLGPTIDLFHPHLVDVLFSSRNGLLAMSPVLYVASVGAVVFALGRPAVGVPILVAFGAMTWFNASIYDWWGSDGFGGRRFDGVVPLLVPGLAMVLAGLVRTARRRPHIFAGATLGVVVIWNLTLMGAAARGDVRLGEPIDFRMVSAAQARDVHQWIGHPFSYPVNLWFAVRNGVGPAAYDLLWPFRFLGDRTRPYGQVDVGGGDDIYIGDGWYAPERDGDRTFRWAGRDATLLIPLDREANLDVQIRLRAFTASGAPGQFVTIETDRGRFGPVEVPRDWNTLSFATPASAWRRGITRMTLRFAWAGRPADIGAGGDTRALAAAVDHVRVSMREASR